MTKAKNTQVLVLPPGGEIVNYKLVLPIVSARVRLGRKFELQKKRKTLTYERKKTCFITTITKPTQIYSPIGIKKLGQIAKQAKYNNE